MRPILTIILLLATVSLLHAQKRRSKQPPGEPYVAINAPDTIYWYLSAPLRMTYLAGPPEASKSVFGSFDHLGPDLIAVTITAFNEGLTPLHGHASHNRKTISAEIMVSAEHPVAIRKPQLIAPIGQLYDPTTEWASDRIPEYEYQTEVEIDGALRSSRQGVTFDSSDPSAEVLRVTKQTRTIVTRVYWRPMGTSERTSWLLILTTDPNDATRGIRMAKDAFVGEVGIE